MSSTDGASGASAARAKGIKLRMSSEIPKLIQAKEIGFDFYPIITLEFVLSNRGRLIGSEVPCLWHMATATPMLRAPAHW